MNTLYKEALFDTLIIYYFKKKKEYLYILYIKEVYSFLIIVRI